MVFFGIGPAEASLDRYGKCGGVCGVTEAFDSEVGGFDHGGATTGTVDVLVGAAEIEIDTIKAETC